MPLKPTEMKPHHGRNIKRIREIMGIKQEALAISLGNEWTQRRISLLEQREEVEDSIIEEMAKVFNISAEAIKSFNEEAAINIIGNTVTNNDNGSVFNYLPTFNPIEKIIQLFEEKEILYREKIALYERLLKEKDDLIDRLSK
jgi:transcriptional regulator with XRE-family HTH domain